MTQDEFAQAIGSHKNTVGRWERGLGEPDIRSISLLCGKLGISPYWLLSGDGPMLDKDRDTKLVPCPDTEAGDLRGLKLSEVRGGSAFDTYMANLQAKWREIAGSLPEGSEDADMEKAFLYHRIKQLEAELAEARTAELKAKDQALEALQALAFNGKRQL
jgi:transcriptional regulator with XRE-family HTH domain